MQSKPLFRKKLVSSLGIIAGAIVFAASATSYAVNQAAQQDCKGGHHAGKQGDRTAAMAQRLEQLKADLKLKPNQEGAWQAYTAKLKEQGEKMKALHQQARADTQLTLPQRLDRRADFMKQQQAGLDERAATLKALYASLTAEQQATMDQHFSSGKRHTS